LMVLTLNEDFERFLASFLFSLVTPMAINISANIIKKIVISTIDP
jgi:hypothetical protein